MSVGDATRRCQPSDSGVRRTDGTTDSHTAVCVFVVPERSIRSPKDKRPTTTNENTVSQTDRQKLTERVCLALGSLTQSVRSSVSRAVSFSFSTRKSKQQKAKRREKEIDRRVEEEEEDKNKRTTGKNKQSQMGRNGEEVRGK